MKQFKRIKHKGVAQRDKCGNLINEFPNIKTAAEISGVPYASISNALNGRAESGYGFVWEYTTPEKYKPARREYKSLCVAVVQYNAFGEKLDEFPSITAAANKTGVSVPTIRRALRTGKITAHGFVFCNVGAREEQAKENEKWNNNYKKYF